MRGTEGQIKRRLETGDLPGLLYNNLEHPRWDEVATRCLSCTNCTMVCPTCFCHSTEEVPDLEGMRSDRVRGGIPASIRACPRCGGERASGDSLAVPAVAHAQAGLVDRPVRRIGLRRLRACITWCPVGIDLTEEVAAIRGGTRHECGEPRRRPEDVIHYPHAALFRAVAAGNAWRRDVLAGVPGATNPAGLPSSAGPVQHGLPPGRGRGPDLDLGARRRRRGVGHTIRFVGRVTNALQALRPGAVIGLADPFGRAWPLEGRRQARRGARRRGARAGALRPAVWPCWPAVMALGPTDPALSARVSRATLLHVGYRRLAAKRHGPAVTVDRADPALARDLSVLCRSPLRKARPRPCEYAWC